MSSCDPFFRPLLAATYRFLASADDVTGYFLRLDALDDAILRGKVTQTKSRPESSVSLHLRGHEVDSLTSP